MQTNDPASFGRSSPRLPPAQKQSKSDTIGRFYSLIFAGANSHSGLHRFNLTYRDIARFVRTTRTHEMLEKVLAALP